MAYQWHVFLSYRRAPPVSRWLHGHFRQLLEEWLAEAEVDWSSIGPSDSVRIFNDQQYIRPGALWPDELRAALATSCLLVPVWSPRYFQSPWCMAELQTMLARERLVEERQAGTRAKLIFPVRFTDGIPASFASIQYEDFGKPLNQSVETFRNTVDYVEFERKIQVFAEDLAQALEAVPPWCDDWPVELPEVEAPSGFGIPRFG